MPRSSLLWIAVGAAALLSTGGRIGVAAAAPSAGGRAAAGERPRPALTLTAGSPTCAKDGAKVHLSWNEVPGTTTYKVELDGETVLLGDRSARAFTGESLHPGAAYSFQVQAFDGRHITRSNPVSVSISPGLCASEPPGPFKLTLGSLAYDPAGAAGGDGGATVPMSWTGSDWAEAYDVYRDGKLLMSGVRRLTFRDRQIRLGHVYTYTVRARNAKGLRDSNPATLELPPA